MTPADLGIAAAINDARHPDGGFIGHPTRMWLVTFPTAISELCDVLWECNWTDLGNAFKGGLDGSEVYGLYTDEDAARKVAVTLMAQRDRKGN